MCLLAGLGAAPQLGQASVSASMLVEPGGLTLDWTSAHSAGSAAQLDVSWNPVSGKLHIAQARRDVVLADWEMAALTSVVLAHPELRSLTISIDRVTDDDTPLYFSPALADGRSLVDWLARADTDFAALVMQEPDRRRMPELHRIAPIVVAQGLLQNDPSYRNLTRDLTLPPFSWPRLELSVSDLASPTPVVWDTDPGIFYKSPHAAVVSPNDVADLIPPEVGQKPYVAFEAGVETNPAFQRAILDALPTVEAAARYVVALASLSIYCEDHRSVCAEWRDQSLARIDPNDVPQPAPLVEGDFVADASMRFVLQWSDVRLQEWASTSDEAELRAMYVDQLVGVLNGVAATLPPQYPLPVNLRGDVHDSLLLDLLEAEVDSLFASSASATVSAMDRWKHSFDALLASNDFSAAEKQLWSDHTMFVYLQLGDASNDAGIIRRAKAERTILVHACKDAAEDAAREAADTPMSRSLDEWREALGRWQNHCQPVAGIALAIDGRLHYAIGIRALAADDVEQARDRARMIESIASVMREHGLETDAVALEGFASDLRARADSLPSRDGAQVVSVAAPPVPPAAPDVPKSGRRRYRLGLDADTYWVALSVAATPRWIPSGYTVGGRAMVRIAAEHEVGAELAAVEYSGFGVPFHHVMALAHYERVYRPDRHFRPHWGFSAGGVFPTSVACAHDGLFTTCPVAAGVLMAGGGFRVGFTPWLSVFVNGFVGGLTAEPHLMFGAGGGLEFHIPLVR